MAVCNGLQMWMDNRRFSVNGSACRISSWLFRILCMAPFVERGFLFGCLSRLGLVHCSSMSPPMSKYWAWLRPKHWIRDNRNAIKFHNDRNQHGRHRPTPTTFLAHWRPIVGLVMDCAIISWQRQFALICTVWKDCPIPITSNFEDDVRFKVATAFVSLGIMRWLTRPPMNCLTHCSWVLATHLVNSTLACNSGGQKQQCLLPQESHLLM